MSDEANLPWFKFYPQEFMGDENVQLMGPAELGIYIAMLCHQWKAGAVPDDPKMVARICRGTPDQVEEAWTLIRPCFEPDGERDGYIVQPRLEKERAAAIRRRESARNAAQAKADGNAERDADRSADGNADRTPERGAMRASNASDGQKNRDTEVTELQEVQTADSDESALRALADLGSNPPEDEEVRKRVTDALVKAWLSLQPVRPPEKQIGKQGAAAKRLAKDTAPRKLAIALYGLEHLWEHGEKGSPWDLFTLEKKLAKALKKGVEVMRNGGGSEADRRLKRKQRKAMEAIS